jgi:hypothetical protein
MGESLKIKRQYSLIYPVIASLFLENEQASL